MKRIFGIIAALMFVFLASCPALAAPTEDVSVEIVSPTEISSNPVYYDKVVIRVTNNGNTSVNDLRCFLTVLDVGREQTLPVDEFGADAYQSRTIDSLAPGQSTEVVIPVRIMYVGDFRFTATVADCASNALYTGRAISVNMLAVSSMNKTFVIMVAACVPLILAGAAFVLTCARK